MSSPVSPPPPASTTTRSLPPARWLRIGLLLFAALTLALGLQALLLVHKEGELLRACESSAPPRAGRRERDGCRCERHEMCGA